MTRFSNEDLVRVRQAVQAAEERTRGEIVPMIVPASARYRESRHLVGLVAALLALSAFLTVESAWGPHEWATTHPGWIVLSAMAAYLIGHAIGTLPWCVRLFTSKERMATKVRLRAEAAFHQHGLHKTKEATGILIMISLLERRVQVLADRAINDRVASTIWDDFVKELVQGIHDGRPADALCRTILKCGDLLSQYFPARGGDNPNELADDVIRER